MKSPLSAFETEVERRGLGGVVRYIGRGEELPLMSVRR
jgi:hypothetical protein